MFVADIWKALTVQISHPVCGLDTLGFFRMIRGEGLGNSLSETALQDNLARSNKPSAYSPAV